MEMEAKHDLSPIYLTPYIGRSVQVKQTQRPLN
jgi:hypothetical protein